MKGLELFLEKIIVTTGACILLLIMVVFLTPFYLMDKIYTFIQRCETRRIIKKAKEEEN